MVSRLSNELNDKVQKYWVECKRTSKEPLPSALLYGSSHKSRSESDPHSRLQLEQLGESRFAGDRPHFHGEGIRNITLTY